MLDTKQMGLKDNDELMKRFAARVQDIFGNVQNSDRKLVVDSVTYGKPNYDPEDYGALHNAIVHKKTVGVPYYINARLIEKDTGKVIDKTKMRLGLLPVQTKMNTFIVNGSNYNVPLQFRLKAGAYPRISDTGEVETFHNVYGGVPMRTQIDAKNKTLSLNIRQGSVPMIGVLKILGATEKEMVKAMGRELYNINNKGDYDAMVKKAYRSIFKKAPPDILTATDELKAYFAKLKTYPEVNKTTLGTAYKKIDKNYMLDSIKQTIGLVKGDTESYNRDSLAFKHVLSPIDSFDDAMERFGRRNVFTYKGKMSLPKATKVKDVVNRSTFDKTVRQFFTTSQISRFADQTNPVAQTVGPMMTTLMGEGGIGNIEAVTHGAKLVQNSSMGFLDAQHTPESQSAGSVLTLSKDTKKVGDKLKTKVINVVTGRTTWLDPVELQTTFLAFPNEMERKGKSWVSPDNEVWGVLGEKITSQRPHTVRYMLASPSGMFDIASLSTPFMHSNQGNRLLTSAKMSTQAVSLPDRESPLVDINVDGENYTDMIGRESAILSPCAGTVDSVVGNVITIKDNKGKKHKISTFRNTPLNEKSFADHTIIVKPGDKVSKNQLLADSNFTVGGKYSPGVNLNTAYVPWKGLNYNDACVITQSAADKMRSEHIQKITLPLRNDNVMDLKHYMATSPYGIDPKSVSKYDKDGVIKPGTEIGYGDLLVAALKKHEPRPSDVLIQKMKKSSLPKFDDDSVNWKNLSKGLVTDVHKSPKEVTIYVKTSDPFRIGDKLTGRHGNKMIVADIIPDELAPVTASGEKVDLLIDPLSVPSRINVGQLLETAAGKVAKKQGSPFIVNNFDPKRDYRTEILSDMKRLGIPETEDIFDPSTNKTLPNVFTGTQYIYKLKHQVEAKQSSRGLGESYTIDESPTSGGGQGGMTIDNLTGNVLLAHGARDFMGDAMNIKNNRNAEYWNAIMRGELPQPPKGSREWDKFMAYLTGMGINVKRNDTKLKLTPLTDKDILSLSRGTIKDPSRMFTSKGVGIAPDKNGLFGTVADSTSGRHYTHIQLADRIVNPTYKDAIKTVLHITDKEYDNMLEK